MLSNLGDETGIWLLMTLAARSISSNAYKPFLLRLQQSLIMDEGTISEVTNSTFYDIVLV